MQKAATMQSAEKGCDIWIMKEVWVYVKVPGPGEAAAKSFEGSGLKITLIKDVTPIPHSGADLQKV